MIRLARAPGPIVFRFLTAALLLTMFGLALVSAGGKSPAYDEQGYIVRGLGYLRGENRHMRIGHPLGLNALNASLLVPLEQVQLPIDDPSWQGTSFHRPGELFLWEIGNDTRQVMFLARLPTMWLGLLLAAFAARWAGKMGRSHSASLLVLALVALDPNILAHMRLTTTDLGLAAGATVAGYSLWRFLRRPSWRAASLAGIGFGLLQNTKFTAGLFVPLFALVIITAVVAKWWERRHVPAALLLQLLLVYPVAGFLTLWAAYAFQVGTLPANLATFPQLSGLTLPLAHHLEQLLDIGGRLQQGSTAFLLGQISNEGWWYYFPVAFALKTPLPTLVLLAWAGARALRWGWCAGAAENRKWVRSLDLVALLVPALGYFAFALTTDINLGYRHLLPIVPFLYVFIAVSLCQRSGLPRGRSQRAEQLGAVALIGWLALNTTFIFPHFLAFFNGLAGGPENGWRALVDSNIDWGQDLEALSLWLDDNEVEHVWLSYFGEANPDYYGIQYSGLDSFPPRLMNPAARPFYPRDPAPGIYAISVTNLQGVHFANHDQFARFRDRDPIDKIGYSIFIYQVPARGEAADLALGGLQLDELHPADFARFETNDVTPHWFDPEQSLLLPTGSNAWLVLPPEAPLPPGFQILQEIGVWSSQPSQGPYALFRARQPLFSLPALAELSNGDGGGPISLLDSRINETIVRPGEELILTTVWQQQGDPRPVKIFVHVVDESDAIVAQWDGLGAVWEGWRSGDRLWQRHRLTLPPNTPSGCYAVWVGLYEPNSLQRWSMAAGGDRYLLDSIIIH